MITADHAWLMARHNACMNAPLLYAACATLPDAALREDRGAFFGSIKRTLGHLATSDRSFLAWVHGKS